MKRKLFLPLFSLAMLGFAVMHVVRANQVPPKPSPPIEPARTPYKFALAGSGVVEPRTENISIGSHLPGVVSKIHVHVGQSVKAGSPLFELDDRQLRAEWEVRKSNLLSAKAQLEKLQNQPRPEEIPPVEARVREAKVSVADAKDQLQRAQQLIRSRAIGEEEVIRRSNAVLVAEAQLARAEADLALLKSGAWKFDKKIAEANIAQAQALLEQTETELKRIVVTAPVDAMVLQKNIREGEYVGSPPGQALIVLGDITQLHVRVDIDENDLSRFRTQLNGRASLRGDPKSSIPLKFVRIEPFVVPKKALTGAGTERVDTRVLQVIYSVQTTQVPLYVGQQLDVYLDRQGEEGR
jgi:multidrug efflux pump subunit AcrA (membrane-fusion protein)